MLKAFTSAFDHFGHAADPQFFRYRLASRSVVAFGGCSVQDREGCRLAHARSSP
jgi:hypothetical protein